MLSVFSVKLRARVLRSKCPWGMCSVVQGLGLDVSPCLCGSVFYILWIKKAQQRLSLVGRASARLALVMLWQNDIEF